MKPVWEELCARRMSIAMDVQPHRLHVPQDLKLRFSRIFEVLDWLNGAIDGAEVNGLLANDPSWIVRTR